MPRPLRLHALTLLLAIAPAGCPLAPTIPPEAPADARGSVTRKPPALQEYAFLMEELPGTERGDKYYVRVTPRTRILEETGAGGIREADLDDVTVGATVEVWFSGPIMESYPAQGTAATVLVTAPAP